MTTPQELIQAFDCAALYGPRIGFSRLIRLSRALNLGIYVDKETEIAILKDPTSAIDVDSI
ncbi:MAG: hypothetical protein Sylvanvirus14_10 [Sylvanvirus sp.]|uniref:Uncharacterized protein n=1 Tax=Sylvanvirus sp. TaxID=2487774 RepID=A0A3G5AI85_9VIRU|nr:MAG: hypothetical protein Sylvanvirus14_10 [Sylvanvirus sp.]